MHPFDHKTGRGHVPFKRGHYYDARRNRKARVRLLCHEIFGGMSAYAAKYLRRLAREATEKDTDRTDYTRSYTARSFVPYYAQRISYLIVTWRTRHPQRPRAGDPLKPPRQRRVRSAAKGR